MSNPIWIGIGVVVVVIVVSAATLVVRGNEGRCRYDVHRRHARFDCSYPPSDARRPPP